MASDYNNIGVSPKDLKVISNPEDVSFGQLMEFIGRRFSQDQRAIKRLREENASFRVLAAHGDLITLIPERVEAYIADIFLMANLYPLHAALYYSTAALYATDLECENYRSLVKNNFSKRIRYLKHASNQVSKLFEKLPASFKERKYKWR
jgi:hypothetical protein